MVRCVAVVDDLIFATRISATAQATGAACRVAATSEAVRSAVQELQPNLLIVDMNVRGVSPTEAIAHAGTLDPPPRVVAFFAHVQADLMRLAQEAGADAVWPRSRFVQELPGLFAS